MRHFFHLDKNLVAQLIMLDGNMCELTIWHVEDDDIRTALRKGEFGDGYHMHDIMPTPQAMQILESFREYDDDLDAYREGRTWLAPEFGGGG